jgi:hypothetical protein
MEGHCHMGIMCYSMCYRSDYRLYHPQFECWVTTRLQQVNSHFMGKPQNPVKKDCCLKAVTKIHTSCHSYFWMPHSDINEDINVKIHKH